MCPEKSWRIIEPLPGRFLDFLDPWGNCIEIVGYDNIQSIKAAHVLQGMGLSHLPKSEKGNQGARRQGNGVKLNRQRRKGTSASNGVKRTGMRNEL